MPLLLIDISELRFGTIKQKSAQSPKISSPDFGTSTGLCLWLILAITLPLALLSAAAAAIKAFLWTQ